MSELQNVFFKAILKNHFLIQSCPESTSGPPSKVKACNGFQYAVYSFTMSCARVWAC